MLIGPAFGLLAAVAPLAAWCVEPSASSAAVCLPEQANQDLSLFAEGVISGVAKPATCEVVEIFGARQVGKHSSSLSGQGPVFRSLLEPAKLFVLTAAHVVANVDRIEISCGGKVFQAKVRGASTTRDLAVLEIIAPEEKLFQPLFEWDGQELPIAEVRHHLPVDHPGYLAKGSHSLVTSSGSESVQLEIVPTPEGHPLVGSRNALLLTRKGAQPGMSGGAIVYSSRDSFGGPEATASTRRFLAGILAKTYVNETESLAIPVETINATLPSLMRGVDPARAKESPYEYSKELQESAEGLQELPTILFHTDKGDQKIGAVCPGPFHNVGKGGSGDSGKGGSGDSGKGGSGDSGKGGSGDSGKGGSGDSSRREASPGNYYTATIYSLYRNRQACKEPGIQDSSGNIYVAVRTEKGVIKAETLEDVSALVQQQGRNFPEHLKTHGIRKSGGEEAYRRFCSDPAVFDAKGRPKRVRIERRDFDPFRPDTAHFTAATEVPSAGNLQGINLRVHCDTQTKTIAVSAKKDGIAFDLKFEAAKWRGTVNFRGCKSEIKDSPKALWWGSHKDQQLDFQFALHPDRDFLDFNIFWANPKCLTGGDTRGQVNAVWLNKLRLKLPAEGAGPDNRYEQLSDSKAEEDRLIESDREQMRVAETAGRKDRLIVAKLIRTFHAAEIKELEKSRVGEVVFRRRIELLHLYTARLEGVLRSAD